MCRAGKCGDLVVGECTTSRGVRGRAGVTISRAGRFDSAFVPYVARPYQDSGSKDDQAPHGLRGFDQQSRRRDSNPEPPNYKEEAIRLIWPASDHVNAAAPTTCQETEGVDTVSRHE